MNVSVIMQGLIEAQTVKTNLKNDKPHTQSTNEKNKPKVLFIDEKSLDSEIVLWNSIEDDDTISIHSQSTQNSDLMILGNENVIDPKSPIVVESDSEDCIMFFDSDIDKNKQGNITTAEQLGIQNVENILESVADDNEKTNLNNKDLNENKLLSGFQKSPTNIKEQLNDLVVINNVSEKGENIPKTKEMNDKSCTKESFIKSIANCETTMKLDTSVVTPPVTETITDTTPNISSNVTSKPPNATETSKHNPHFPYLSEDMNVVKVPSLVLPVLYEKPSITPFREFVDILGKQIEDEHLMKQGLQNIQPKRASPVNDLKRLYNNNNETENIYSDIDFDAVLTSEEINKSLNIALSAGPIKVNDCFSYGIGKLCMSVGHNLVQQYVQNDLLELRKSIFTKEEKAGLDTKATEASITALTNTMNDIIAINKPFIFPLKKCRLCNFKTESQLALEYHLEIPHLKNNIYLCSYCSFKIKSKDTILSHMKNKHNVQARLENVSVSLQCAYCPNEDDSKARLMRHQATCRKRFLPNLNQIPPLDWELPAKVAKCSNDNIDSGLFDPIEPVRRKKPRDNGSNGGRGGVSIMRGLLKSRGRYQITPPPSPPHTSMPAATTKNPSSVKPKPAIPQTSVSVTAAPPSTHPPNNRPVPHRKIVCEMCDGWILDLKQLKVHLKKIHRVKISLKVLQNRPPLSCQKCQARFFTDKGLGRHLLGIHSLVPNYMQEAAKLGKDAGNCPVCKQVYPSKLLEHFATQHSQNLRPVMLSYKCVVCSKTFNAYKQFEKHVRTAHRRQTATPRRAPGVSASYAPATITSNALATLQRASPKPKTATVTSVQTVTTETNE